MPIGAPFNAAAAKVRWILEQLRRRAEDDQIEAELAARARELDAEEYERRVEQRRHSDIDADERSE
jgi:hypothetical protein